MKQFNNEFIRSLSPCYDPIKYIKDDDTHTILSFLDIKEIPFEDKLWLIFRNEFVSDKLMRLFAVWSARQVQHLMTDDRSIKALDVSEKFANGLATQEELVAARDAARAAAGAAAAGTAARAAARAAAGAAARDAAWAAARAAARDAAWDAAWDAGYAAWAAAGAAWDAAGAAWDAQEKQLRLMIISMQETGDVK